MCASAAQHRVREILRLAEALGIPAHAEIVCPTGTGAAGRWRRRSLTPSSMPRRCSTINAGRADGWRKLTAALRERGLGTVVTGASSDRAYLDDDLA